jgi:uncharacterized protein
MIAPSTHVAFAGDDLIRSGPLTDVLAAVKLALDDGETRTVLIFESRTGRQVDFDFRGTLDDVLDRAKPKSAPKGPGRPRLGVESREVTLLPRHWAWLQSQPNGASATLRRLVEAASRRNQGADATRRARDAAYGIMSALAGDRTGFEEAARALFAGDTARLAAIIEPWPADIRDCLLGTLSTAPEEAAVAAPPLPVTDR